MRLIDADCLILKKGDLRWRFETEHDFRQMFEIIGNAETVYKIPVMHGRWKNITGGMIMLGDCSECNERQPIALTNHCRKCGAKMDGDEDD
jgi:hypothetical protein